MSERTETFRCAEHDMPLRLVEEMGLKPYWQCPECHARFIAAVDRTDVIWVIAAELDKPSVYMNGPSPQSKRRATEIVEQLEYRGYEVVLKRVS